ncbi:phosphotransferase family protein [Rhodococcus tukisamuensis]|uniref:Predicted kinase, aminoglycoside phosphotransferase (APT) family n=1 Tax=Rhodococcus tukisamuensis TaxID=168276 RepID=A0A1G6N685_9NOCA|nr:phosphotransferase family protein [Rhodococcus tukisamuensis]SDC62907.1 Predicted kinase, aminoglycoside phosphotransferase (APT) family [Rhodococcus tukisamuensis]
MTPEKVVEDPDYAEFARPGESRNDPAVMRSSLERWLATVLEPSADPAVTAVEVPAANGMSNETVLFDATWTEDGRRSEHRLVARIAPRASAVPIFPSYDLDQQFQVMRAVATHTSVPIPRVYWSENTPDALGGEFFVMERLDGVVPPDVMPYTFGSWLSEASAEDRSRLQQASVRVLAELHSMADPHRVCPTLAGAGAEPTGTAALRAHVAGQRRYYEWVTADGPRSPLIERGFDWIDANVPNDAAPAALCWGDARIGNIMYRDFEPAAVLDWEMATLGPRELDLGWMIFQHRFFEDLAAMAGLPGMPDFLRRDDVADAYLELTGHRPADLDFYTLYAALRHAVIMFRVQSRAVAFGQAELPENPDEMILHKMTLEAMLDGTYWASTTSKGTE